MPLRVRLSIAFTAILLAPALLLGALASQAVAGAENADTSRLLMSQATSAVRGQMLAECDRLAATAEALAIATAARHQHDAVTPAGSSGVWALCGQAPSTGTHYTGLAARAPVGADQGWAYAVRPVDTAFLGRLATAAGLPVTTVDATRAGTALGPLPLRLGPTPAPPASRTMPVALACAIAALVAAVALGTWLAGLVTRPLVHLVAAVEQVAAGDLGGGSRAAGSRMAGLRVPGWLRPTGRDEIGRLTVRLDHFVATMKESQLLAVTDALTGLGNVRQLADSLRIEVERAARFRRSVGVLVLDLDHFKDVNDTYGHRAGDVVLTEFARRLRGVVREVDLAFRQGGEEFVILLPETDVGGSLTAARRLGESVRAEPFQVGQVQIAVTVSIGVAVYPRHAGTGPEALEAADKALYAAKAAGRDTYTVAAGIPTARAELLPTGVVGGASVRTGRTQIPADG